MVLDFATLSPNKIYHTLTQVIIPRPVAWVLSEHANGELNLAPFSYFTPVCSNPPLVVFSVGYKPNGEMKDTAKNILERDHFVIHIASSDLAGQVTQTAAILDDGVSEVSANNLTLVDFD
jgi:flavin reductase (DIM6/NTAB) family NADH-FMN oxidoreductase RutF